MTDERLQQIRCWFLSQDGEEPEATTDKMAAELIAEIERLREELKQRQRIQGSL